MEINNNSTLYEVDSISYLSYAQSQDIRLPRFQRKNIWNDEKKFKLMISIFKGYPIGSIALNEEKAIDCENKLITTTWLLDGQQRRTVLIDAYNNPETIYDWSKQFIKFNNNDYPEHVKVEFWKKIESYLEIDDDDLEVVIDPKLDKNNEEDEVDNNRYDIVNKSNSGKLREDIGLNILLEIIIMCHKRTKNGTSYTKPFKYNGYFKNVPFIEFDDSVNPQKLTEFLRSFIHNCKDRHFTENDFIIFCEKELMILEGKRNVFTRKIRYDWDKINNTINCIWNLISYLEQGNIPVVRLKNVKSSDSQNIFQFINSSGSPLNAVEILSANPSWNKNIKVVSKELEHATNILYSALNIERSGVVKWDVAATIIDRLYGLDYIFKSLTYKSTAELKTKITLGFKLLAGIYEGRINKESLSNLPKNLDINWESDIDLIIFNLNEMGAVLLKSPFFKTLRSWNNSLMGITSEAIALNFIFIIFKEWCESRDKGYYSETLFIKKAISIFDKSIYEYVIHKWRGSSDSKIADNIKHFNSKMTFESIDKKIWIDLIRDMIDNDKINGTKVNIGETKAILYYYYMLSNIIGPGFGSKVDIDHIIPQFKFKKSIEVNKDNLVNLCLLESKINIIKNKNNLNYLEDNNENRDIIQKICESVNLNIEDLKNINNSDDFSKLKLLRQPLIENAFSDLRNKYLKI